MAQSGNISFTAPPSWPFGSWMNMVASLAGSSYGKPGIAAVEGVPVEPDPPQQVCRVCRVADSILIMEDVCEGCLPTYVHELEMEKEELRLFAQSLRDGEDVPEEVQNKLLIEGVHLGAPLYNELQELRKWIEVWWCKLCQKSIGNELSVEELGSVGVICQDCGSTANPAYRRLDGDELGTQSESLLELNETAYVSGPTGFVPPQVDPTTIAAPAAGLIVKDLKGKLQQFDGKSWREVGRISLKKRDKPASRTAVEVNDSGEVSQGYPSFKDNRGLAQEIIRSALDDKEG